MTLNEYYVIIDTIGLSIFRSTKEGIHMDTVEKNARAAHGNFVYRQTWLASTTTEKWRWAIVALSVLGKFVLTLWLFTLLVAISVEFTQVLMVEFLHVIPFSGIKWFVRFVGFFGWLYCELALGSRFVGAASSFYAIAADMVRLKSGKFLVRMVYLLSGGLAVLFALLSWKTRNYREKKFTSGELDVLGSIFSKINKWGIAHQIYITIGNLYMGRYQNGVDAKQLSVSYALASKWMLGDPDTSRRNFRLTAIRTVLDEYEHELDSEVLARLYEPLGDEERVKRERLKIASKLA